MTALIAAMTGAAIVAGLLVIVAGLRRVPADAHHRLRIPIGMKGGTRWRATTPWSRWRGPVALGAAALAWLLSGWPVAGLIVALTIWGLPVLLSTSRDVAHAIDRIEAVEEWARRLGDVLVVGVGLEQAITATVRTCPEPVQPEVSALSARLTARWPTESALRAFADDLDDATGDLIAATLILGARRRGPGLARVMAAVADSVAEEVAMRRKVEAERAKPRATARAVTLITLGVVAIGALNGTYLTPYRTTLGQLVLVAITLGFVGALAWMRALTLTKPEPRFLVSHVRRGHGRSAPTPEDSDVPSHAELT
ncbi:MAG: type II secretion system F family protein [Actinomycetia bacterium]|nr:type II secretion system F family protein [Actinomycetes bacterium]